MSVVSDSHMAMILPDDISERVSSFMAGKMTFPFIKKDEISCLFYLYGKNSKVNGESQVKEVVDLAGRTAAQMRTDIVGFAQGSRTKMDSEFIRSNYVNRELQLVIENREQARKRILGDPVILSSCFAQHASYFGQDYFFQLYGPFKESELISEIRDSLVGRMAMLCYNRKNEADLPFKHALVPLYIWVRDNKKSR